MPKTGSRDAREEQAGKEAARMGEDLKRLQREWRDAQAALDGERRRGNNATAARDHLLESTAAKCADCADELLSGVVPLQHCCHC